MLWIPKFTITRYLLILCTFFDIYTFWVLYYCGIVGLKLVLVGFLILLVSKIPIVIIAEKHFNRRLIWLGTLSVVASILLIIATDILLFMFAMFARQIIVYWCFMGMNMPMLFFQGWLIGNMLLLRVLLIRDITLPSKLSLLLVQEKVDEFAEAIPFI